MLSKLLYSHCMRPKSFLASFIIFPILYVMLSLYLFFNEHSASRALMFVFLGEQLLSIKTVCSLYYLLITQSNVCRHSLWLHSPSNIY